MGYIHDSKSMAYVFETRLNGESELWIFLLNALCSAVSSFESSISFCFEFGLILHWGAEISENSGSGDLIDDLENDLWIVPNIFDIKVSFGYYYNL